MQNPDMSPLVPDRPTSLKTVRKWTNDWVEIYSKKTSGRGVMMMITHCFHRYSFSSWNTHFRFFPRLPYSMADRPNATPMNPCFDLEQQPFPSFSTPHSVKYHSAHSRLPCLLKPSSRCQFVSQIKFIDLFTPLRKSSIGIAKYFEMHDLFISILDR